MEDTRNEMGKCARGKPWGKMFINVEKPYPEVSVPFSALSFVRIYGQPSMWRKC